MYVLLRGQVTVYHNYNAPGDDGSAGNDSSETVSSESTEFRRHLGAFVVTLNGQRVVFTDQFRGPGRAIGPGVSVCPDTNSRQMSRSKSSIYTTIKTTSLVQDIR